MADWKGVSLKLVLGLVTAVLVVMGVGMMLRSAGDDVPLAEKLPVGFEPGVKPPTGGQDELPIFVSRYGTPDEDNSTEKDDPRPPLVTRWIDYKAEGVRVAFYPIGSADQEAHYEGWKVMGYIDTRMNRAITNDEASALLHARLQAR